MRQLPGQEMFNILVKILLVGTWQKKKKQTHSSCPGRSKSPAGSSCFRKTMLILSRLFLSLKHTPWRVGHKGLGPGRTDPRRTVLWPLDQGGEIPADGEPGPGELRAWLQVAVTVGLASGRCGDTCLQDVEGASRRLWAFLVTASFSGGLAPQGGEVDYQQSQWPPTRRQSLFLRGARSDCRQGSASPGGVACHLEPVTQWGLAVPA